jgi:hypothetical protein
MVRHGSTWDRDVEEDVGEMPGKRAAGRAVAARCRSVHPLMIPILFLLLKLKKVHKNSMELFSCISTRNP